MNISLTIQERLKDLRIEKELTLEQLAGETGISKSTLGKYESDDLKDISPFNLAKLADFYGVSVDYLLARTEQKNHPNTELEALHLSDEMIELLKSGRINRRLFCELAVHPDFVKLLSDCEIYIDGIAAMQIRNLNEWVDIACEKIVEKYQPGEDDQTMNTLKASYITEDAYFMHRIHGDMDGILRDLKERHRTDATSAPENTGLEDFREWVEEISEMEGSRFDKWLALFCKQNHINSNKLTTEEKNTLIKIAKKSGILNNSINSRGKGKQKKKRKK